MPRTYPISVFIIAKNEADRIPYAITSVRGWVDEVIVIDSGSTDDTVAISQALGARVETHPWEGYGPQKVFGESLCRNNWLLNIDADEAISQVLQGSIKALFDKGEFPHKAYRLHIKIKPKFADMPGRFAPSNSPIRFYHKQYAGFKDSTIHDSVIFKGPGAKKPGYLKGMVVHRCFRSFSHAVEKINFYSTMQAEDMLAKGRNPSGLRIVVEPFFAFLKAYFLRRYMFLGVSGFVESVIYSFARTLRLAKAREGFINQAKRSK